MDSQKRHSNDVEDEYGEMISVGEEENLIDTFAKQLNKTAGCGLKEPQQKINENPHWLVQL